MRARRVRHEAHKAREQVEHYARKAQEHVFFFVSFFKQLYKLYLNALTHFTQLASFYTR